MLVLLIVVILGLVFWPRSGSTKSDGMDPVDDNWRCAMCRQVYSDMPNAREMNTGPHDGPRASPYEDKGVCSDCWNELSRLYGSGSTI